jgi:hypothetical protein
VLNSATPVPARAATVGPDMPNHDNGEDGNFFVLGIIN